MYIYIYIYRRKGQKIQKKTKKKHEVLLHLPSLSILMSFSSPLGHSLPGLIDCACRGVIDRNGVYFTFTISLFSFCFLSFSGHTSLLVPFTSHRNTNTP